MFEKNKIDRLLKELNLSDEQREVLLKEISIPVKLIGIGQTGVGKTELLKSIFNVKTKDSGRKEEVIAHLKTGSVKSVTKEFYSFTIKSGDGFLIQFTDGPGLGEADDLENKYMKMWVDEIPKHDMLYWVLDGSSRDIGHIQKNMKYILDETNYRSKLVVVLNKVDQILLPQEMELKGMVGWDLDFNLPTKSLEKLIKERTDDIIEKLTNYVDIDREQIVVCSARKRWNHEDVLDTFLKYTPENKRIKASMNREIKDPTELMSETGKDKLNKVL